MRGARATRPSAVRAKLRGAGATLLVGLLLGGIGAGVLSGCGATNATPAELRLQREDLVAVSKALKQVEGPVAVETVATKRAWPLVANGLPGGVSALAATRAPVMAATASAAKIPTPALLRETQALALTGPGAQLAGLFRTYQGLVSRGWNLTGASIEEIQHGPPASARFARDNVGLYIESVYDGHFDLAQIGKHLTDGYRKLGGPSAFGSALTQDEADSLADAYSEATVRLHPHVGVRLGS